MTASIAKPPRGALGVLVVVGAVGLVGCGGDTTQALGPPVSPPSTTTQDTQAATTAVKATPKKRSETTAKTAAKRRTAAATTPKLAAKPKLAASKATPLGCLRKAGLARVRKQAAGVWGARDPTTAAAILVDGPYKTVREAKQSAASLSGVQHAAQGGLYEVSAALRARVAATVRWVAECLDGRG